MITTSNRTLLRFALVVVLLVISVVATVTISGMFSEPDDVEASLVVVSNLAVESANEYEVLEGLASGLEIYSDRCGVEACCEDQEFCYSYNETVPFSLRGVTYIKTANGDKGASDEVFMTFDIDRDVTIYVAYDSRALTFPDWLSEPEGWSDSGETIGIFDSTHILMRKEYPAGSHVELGGNFAEGSEFPSAAFSNYTVMVAELPILILGEDTVNAGDQTTISVFLDRIPSGLAAYDITVVFNNPVGGDFVDAEFPTFGPPTAFFEITDDGARIRIVASDIAHAVQEGDTNILLANLTVEGGIEGTTSIDFDEVQLEPEPGSEPTGSDIQLLSGSLTVLNVLPNVIVGADTFIEEGEDLSQLVLIDDPGDVSWSVTVDYGDDTGPEEFTATDTNLILSHFYADNDDYTVSVSIADEEGSDSDSFDVSVQNASPELSASEDKSGTEGDIISIDVANFNDSGTLDTHSANVNWGDGTSSPGIVIEIPFGPPGDEAGLNGMVLFGDHIYADDGVYDVILTLTDDDGGSDSDTLEVTINNANPTLIAGGDQTTRVGDVVHLQPALFNDKGTLDTHSDIAPIIDWGDGTFLTGTVVESPFGPPGSEDGANGIINGSHVYKDIGTFTATINLFDDDGGSATDSFEVEVSGLTARFEFQLQGDDRPATPAGWEKQTTVTLFRVGPEIPPIVTTSTFDPVNTIAFVEVPDLEIGVYDISVSSESTLANIRRDVLLDASKTVDMGALPSGEGNDDGIIDISDFGLLALAYETQDGEAGYNPQVDFDANGLINQSDYDILVSNFAKFSPVEVTD